MAERTNAPPQEESLYQEMLRYQNENNIEDENDIIGAGARRKKKEPRSRSPPPPADGTPSSRSRKGTTPPSGRRKQPASSGRRSPMNVAPTVTSDDHRKPGIVAVDQPAIHPNSAMYHAAYDRPVPTPAPAPTPTSAPTINTAEIVATPVSMSGSGPTNSSFTPSSGRAARSPTRFDPRQASRSKSPRMDTFNRQRAKKPEVIDALCVSAHNPNSRPKVKPLDPLSASEHNPMFFSSIDENLQTSQHVKKSRGKSPKKGLDAIGKPIKGIGNAVVGGVGAVGGAVVGGVGAVGGAVVGGVGAVGGAVVGGVGAVGGAVVGGVGAVGGATLGAVGGLGTAVGGVLGLSKDKKNKVKRSTSDENLNHLELEDPPTFDKNSRTRSKSPKLAGRSRKNSVPDNINADVSQHQMSSPDMPVFSETNRDRGSVGAPRERGRRGGSVEPGRRGSVEPKEEGRRRRGSVDTKEESRRRRGSVEPNEDGHRRRGGSVEPRDGDGSRRRGGSVEPRDGDRRRLGSVEPKESRRRRGGSVESKPESSRSRGSTEKRTKSPGPSRRERSPTRGTPESTTTKRPGPSPNLARPGIAGRAATTGSTDIFSELYSHSSTPTPHQVERSSSDMPPSSSQSYERRTSSAQDQLDADLLLALELSKQDAQQQQQQQSVSAPPQIAQPNFQRAPPKSKPRAVSPKPPPSGGSVASFGGGSVASFSSTSRSSPVSAAKPPPAAARQPQPASLDHFAGSNFDASKADADDESTLTDVLYALKISAEEEAARKRTELQTKTMTSIQELLELEERDRLKNGASSDDDDDDFFHSSVMDLVAHGLSTQPEPSSSSNHDDDAANQKSAYERMQEEEEQRQLEMALKASEEALDAMKPAPVPPTPPPPENQVDADLRMAMEVSRDELDLDGASEEDFMLQQQRAMEEFAARKAKKQQAPLDHERGRNSLVERGTQETQRAISAGKAHIVTCRGCQAQLQAPIAYSLVFCPNCQTVSPTGM